MPVVFCADANYGIYLPVTIQSIIKNSSKDHHYIIIVFDCGIDQDIIVALQKQISTLSNFSLRLKNIEDWLERHSKVFRSVLHFTPAIYGRLFIPELCSEYGKVIYADIDIVFDRDIAELAELNLGENYIGGVVDIGNAAVSALQKQKRRYQREVLGLENELLYVNSGLLIFNVRQWLKFKLSERIIAFLGEKKDLFLPDQDAINCICKGKIFYLPHIWNCTILANEYLRHQYFTLKERNMSSLIRASDEYFEIFYSRDKVCCHYTGEVKPWKNLDVPKAGLWWKYAAGTPFYIHYVRDLTADFIGHKFYSAERIIKEENNEEHNYSVLGIPLWKVKKAKWGKRYGIGCLRLAKTRIEGNRTHIYILGVKCASVRRK